jgi:amino acid adenylation domain-containing protein
MMFALKTSSESQTSLIPGFMNNTATLRCFSPVDLGRSDILLQLPYDRLPTPQTGFRLGSLPSVGFAWPNQGSRASLAVSRANILAACVALFYRYSGQTQIPLLIEASVAQSCSRLRTMAFEVSGRDTLVQLQQNVVAALDNEEGEIEVNGAAPVLISYSDRDSSDGLRPEGVIDHTKLDIHLKFRATSDSLSAALDYNSSLFDPDTVTRLLRHLQSVFAAIAADSSTAVADLPLFSDGELIWFDDRCTGPIVHYPDQPIHVEFESWVALDPKKTAVMCGNKSLSYEELNRQANQVARYLLAKGMGVGHRVVACLEPSLEVVSTLLGILKSGATYVPVNPGHPKFRIDAVLDDTQPSLIFTQSHLSELSGSAAAEIVCIDRPPESLARQSPENPDVDISPEGIAYIFYTSGTTGKPKGVMASHANMINFIHASRDRYGIVASDLMPAVASYTFSISMFELMSPLSVGATLLLLEREHVLDAARMAETLQEVTIFHIGPSLLKNIVKYIKHAYPEYSCFSGVKHASSGGDMVPPELLSDMQEIFAKAEIFVIYGCSEISLMGCTWEATDSPVTRTFVGSPLANVRLLVLDDDGNQVPPGAVGDVCFGGKGVVSGYQNRPKMTAQSFFERDGIRCYRTGDRGRLDMAGNLELMGRRDFQIQLRGMRIELGEIDYHLRHAEGVRDGIVVAKDRSNSDKVLVAYYVPEEDDAVDVVALRDHMAERLPDYMVPTFYVGMEALPLNHNLKVDRNALPDYVAPEQPLEHPPESKTELSLAEIWCELLQRTSIDVRDNFMSLGGDSLLAMQLIFLVEQKFGCKLDGLEILRESLAVMAQLVDQRTGRTSVEDKSAEQIASRIHPLSSFYFGRDNSLYGLFQQPLEQSESTPVLICPPIGYEYTRCQYFLHLLAENLASAGVPSLRFDFFGTGDSCGRDRDATFARWREDLVEAYDELELRTGAETVRVFGFRLNTMLALRALQDKPVDRWVCWDPVTQGQHYYEELRRMTLEEAKKLLVIRNLRTPSLMRDAEELVGMTFSSAAIQEMTSLVLDHENFPIGGNVCQVLSADYSSVAESEQQRQIALAGLPSVLVDEECGWYSTTRMTSPITQKLLLEQIQNELIGPSRS